MTDIINKRNESPIAKAYKSFNRRTEYDQKLYHSRAASMLSPHLSRAFWHAWGGNPMAASCGTLSFWRNAKLMYYAETRKDQFKIKPSTKFWTRKWVLTKWKIMENYVRLDVAWPRRSHRQKRNRHPNPFWF